jgi:hypothetical protein
LANCLSSQLNIESRLGRKQCLAFVYFCWLNKKKGNKTKYRITNKKRSCKLQSVFYVSRFKIFVSSRPDLYAFFCQMLNKKQAHKTLWKKKQKKTAHVPEKENKTRKGYSISSSFV